MGSPARNGPRPPPTTTSSRAWATTTSAGTPAAAVKPGSGASPQTPTPDGTTALLIHATQKLVIHFYLCHKLQLVSPGSCNSVVAFNQMNTHSTDQRQVTCCGIDQAPTDVLCGQVKDCATACKAVDESASLSPTGRCDDCENIQQGYSCLSSSESSCANSCRDCHVRQDPSCCYHPRCRDLRPVICAWTDNYWGKSCVPFQIAQFSAKII